MRPPISDDFPFLQVAPDVYPKCVDMAPSLECTPQHAFGAMIRFWGQLANRRYLAGKTAVVMTATELARRLKLVFGHAVELETFVDQGFLEPQSEADSYRVRGMSRYIDAEVRRRKIIEAALEREEAKRRTGERPALETSCTEGATATPVQGADGVQLNCTGTAPQPQSNPGAGTESLEFRVESLETVVVEEEKSPNFSKTTTTPQSGPSADFEGRWDERRGLFLAFWNESRGKLGMAAESPSAELLSSLESVFADVDERCPDDPLLAESHLVIDFLHDTSLRKHTLATLLHPNVLPERLNAACAKAIAEPRRARRRSL
jgi:hypothetical protein